jgi:hypothetical protein
MTDAPPSAGLIALADRIELWPVDRLRPYERNPRTHSEAQVDQIAASMVEFGWTNPVLVDEQGGILAGQAPRQVRLSPGGARRAVPDRRIRRRAATTRSAPWPPRAQPWSCRFRPVRRWS